MQIKIRLPDWGWIHRLVENLHPGLHWRAEKWGRTSERASFLFGGVEVTTTASKDD